MAGARTLVISLWKVPDAQTQELMVDSYQRILRGEPRAEALRQEQQALREARICRSLLWAPHLPGRSRPPAKLIRKPALPPSWP